MVYAITYDLNKPGQDYARLYSTIKTLGDWIWPLQNLWLVDSEKGSQEIADLTHAVIDPNDAVFVVRVNGYQWGSWMDKKVNDWINVRI